MMWLWLLACADETTCPDGSMSASEGGLVVTEAEHGEGWGQAACTGCHALDALHLRACTPGVDMEALRDEVDAGGLATCTECHGDNGGAP